MGGTDTRVLSMHCLCPHIRIAAGIETGRRNHGSVAPSFASPGEPAENMIPVPNHPARRAVRAACMSSHIERALIKAVRSSATDAVTVVPRKNAITAAPNALGAP